MHITQVSLKKNLFFWTYNIQAILYRILCNYNQACNSTIHTYTQMIAHTLSSLHQKQSHHGYVVTAFGPSEVHFDLLKMVICNCIGTFWLDDLTMQCKCIFFCIFTFITMKPTTKSIRYGFSGPYSFQNRVQRNMATYRVVKHAKQS